MSDKRWVSHGLVDMLMEMRKYDSAAEVVSGSENIFTGLSKRIDDAIARVREQPDGSEFRQLKNLLDEASEEIRDHQEWQQDVFEKLASEEDHCGLSRSLRQAFNESAAARTKLLDQVMRSCDQYLKVQERAFNLER